MQSAYPTAKETLERIEDFNFEVTSADSYKVIIAGLQR